MEAKIYVSLLLAGWVVLSEACKCLPPPTDECDLYCRPLNTTLAVQIRLGDTFTATDQDPNNHQYVGWNLIRVLRQPTDSDLQVAPSGRATYMAHSSCEVYGLEAGKEVIMIQRISQLDESARDADGKLVELHFGACGQGYHFVQVLERDDPDRLQRLTHHYDEMCSAC